MLVSLRSSSALPTLPYAVMDSSDPGTINPAALNAGKHRPCLPRRATRRCL